MIRVLVVEDSPTVLAALEHILNADPDITVIGTAGDGVAALEFLKHTMPDVVTMDVHMPRLNGLEATRRIMETRPVPIIIVSASYEPDEVDKTFHALEAGAVAVASKPGWIGQADQGRLASELVRTVKAMAGIKLVRRWPRPDRPVASALAVAVCQEETANLGLVAIGASTGGPLALQTILSGLPEDFPAPIAVVQHIAPGFLDGLVRWLGQATHLRTEIAANGACLQPGHVYLAPDGRHLGIDRRGRVVLSDDDPENGLRPSISHLFRSVARSLGADAVGVLLTGMGTDGAKGLRLMKEGGAITVAQDQESSAVYGMPGAAIELDAACRVLPPEGIADMLRLMAGPGASGQAGGNDRGARTPWKGRFAN